MRKPRAWKPGLPAREGSSALIADWIVIRQLLGGKLRLCLLVAIASCQWSSIFPVEIKTPIQSLIFIKRMMAISVSCITYLRGIFPEDAYRMRYLEEIGIKILREDSSYPQASKLIKWMKGCFDALERKYLQMVILGVYKNTDNPSSLIESYQFKFNYTTKGPQMDIVSDRKHLLKNCTMDDIKSASISLIRKIFFLMHNLGPLPSDVSLTMKLFYYDAVTPVMYQPPGFKEGENHTILFEGNPVQVKLAEVPTSFHLIKVRVTTEQERMENLQHRSVLKEEKEYAEPQKVHGNTAARKPEVKTRKPKVNRTSRKRRQKRL